MHGAGRFSKSKDTMMVSVMLKWLYKIMTSYGAF